MEGNAPFFSFYFVFKGNFQVQALPPPRGGGADIWRGDLTEGFLRYEFGGLYLEGLIHGGAYTWRGSFSEFYGIVILKIILMKFATQRSSSGGVVA